MKYLYLIFLIALYSCVKDSVTLSKTIFTNSTLHQINLVGYKNGIIDQECTFSLNPNESKSVFVLNNRGIGNGLSFGGYFQSVDSFVVNFDNMNMISHYKPNLIGTNTKKYLFYSSRNIFNDSNYLKNITIDRKYRREWDFKYTFVEQDYIDAR